mgnify:CR=1 FL=1
MNPVQLINRKKSGIRHSAEEINWIVNHFTQGKISDAQMASWLMAVNFNGLDPDETIEYTRALVESGETIQFTDNQLVIDKHSTGGVGDKVSFVLGPILAALGYRIPMLAGRGLEHTGGTIDKLEAIPGFNTNIPLPAFQKIVESIGLAIMSQTDEICPADGQIYSLRDKTATVNSLALICGSILSKKIAEGISTLVLDIKIGNGAFMPTVDEAESLGKLMKTVGEEFDLEVIPCYTNMDQPLGKTAGLWCEVIESWEALNGHGAPDLMAVVNHLSTKIIGEGSIQKVNRVIEDGTAKNKFLEMIFNQGGDEKIIIDNSINSPAFNFEISAKKEGYISNFNTKDIGFALAELGAGKIFSDDILDFSCGCEFFKKTGEWVDKDEPIAMIFGSNKLKVQGASLKINDAITLNLNPPKPQKIILNSD